VRNGRGPADSLSCRETEAVRRWRVGQKVAFLVGLAAALYVLGRLFLAPDPFSSDGGWFNYAPNSGLAYSPFDAKPPAVVAAVWLVAIATWTGVAVWLLGRRDSSD
jgi:hypothetical protein